MTLINQNKAFASRVAGPETERYVPLSEIDAIGLERPRQSRHYRYKPHYGHYRPQGRRRGDQAYKRSPGQALLMVAIMMTVLVLFVGLGVDVGNLMGKRAKLQSAVDASALSAAQLMSDSSASVATITTKAYQMLEANNVTSDTLAVRQVDVYTTTSQVHIHADQKVDTFFMRLVPAWKQVDITADATADLNAFAEINIKPFGIPGVVNELNISIWGQNSWRTGGDAYTPAYISGNTVNPEHAKMPYGYLYRIDVPSDFPDNHLLVQIFDPDSYNNPTPPPTPWTPVAATATFCPFPCLVSTATPYATPTFYPNDGRYTWCDPAANSNLCTTWLINGATNQRYNTGVKVGAFPLTTTPVPTAFDSQRRAAFWRVDEMRNDRNSAEGINPSGSEWNDAWADTTTYTLWHFDPHITSAFGDPNTLTDLTGGNCVGASGSNCIASYTVGADPTTDLAWYQPNGFDIKLSDPTDPNCNYSGSSHDCFDRETNGNFYFYIYVNTSAGSSENNFDLRVGPRNTNYAQGYTCNNLSNPNTNICFANTQYFEQVTFASPPNDWDSGGNAPAVVFAKRALPLNLDANSTFSLLFTQVSKNAAGQTLAIRHFDQDCTGGCGPTHTMQYQMQLCVSDGSGGYTPCSDLNSGSCFGNPTPPNGIGYTGPNNGWLCPDGYDGNCPITWTQTTEKVQIPVEGTTDYTSFFGPNGECSSSWLRLQSDPSYPQDTTVWEMPFARPRLIK